jgi:hypothetical protein
MELYFYESASTLFDARKLSGDDSMFRMIPPVRVAVEELNRDEQNQMP